LTDEQSADRRAIVATLETWRAESAPSGTHGRR